MAINKAQDLKVQEIIDKILTDYHNEITYDTPLMLGFALQQTLNLALAIGVDADTLSKIKSKTPPIIVEDLNFIGDLTGQINALTKAKLKEISTEISSKVDVLKKIPDYQNNAKIATLITNMEAQTKWLNSIDPSKVKDFSNIKIDFEKTKDLFKEFEPFNAKNAQQEKIKALQVRAGNLIKRYDAANSKINNQEPLAYFADVIGDIGKLTNDDENDFKLLITDYEKDIEKFEIEITDIESQLKQAQPAGKAPPAQDKNAGQGAVQGNQAPQKPPGRPARPDKEQVAGLLKGSVGGVSPPAVQNNQAAQKPARPAKPQFFNTEKAGKELEDLIESVIQSQDQADYPNADVYSKENLYRRLKAEVLAHSSDEHLSVEGTQNYLALKKELLDWQKELKQMDIESEQMQKLSELPIQKGQKTLMDRMFRLNNEYLNAYQRQQNLHDTFNILHSEISQFNGVIDFKNLDNSLAKMRNIRFEKIDKINFNNFAGNLSEFNGYANQIKIQMSGKDWIKAYLEILNKKHLELSQSSDPGLENEKKELDKNLEGIKAEIERLGNLGKAKTFLMGGELKKANAILDAFKSGIESLEAFDSMLKNPPEPVAVASAKTVTADSAGQSGVEQGDASEAGASAEENEQDAQREFKQEQDEKEALENSEDEQEEPQNASLSAGFSNAAQQYGNRGDTGGAGSFRTSISEESHARMRAGYQALKESPKSTVKFESDKIEQKQYDAFIKSSQDYIEQESKKDGLYKGVKVNKEKNEITIPKDDSTTKKDVLTREYNAQTNTAKISLTYPPGDTGIMILFDTNKELPVLSMKGSDGVADEKTLLKIYQAAVLSGRSLDAKADKKIEFGKKDMEKLNNIDTFKEMQKEGFNFKSFVEEFEKTNKRPYVLGDPLTTKRDTLTFQSK